MSPAHNLVVSLPIVSIHQFCGQKFSWAKVKVNLASPGNRTRPSAVGVRRHNDNATNYSWVPNFTVNLYSLLQSKTDLGNISLSNFLHKTFFTCFSAKYPLLCSRHTSTEAVEVALRAWQWKHNPNDHTPNPPLRNSSPKHAQRETSETPSVGSSRNSNQASKIKS